MSPEPESLLGLTRPWKEPSRRWKVDGDDRATIEVLSGRQVSGARVTVPRTRAAQRRLAFTPGEPNESGNLTSTAVAKLRDAGDPGITAATSRLLERGRLESNSPRLFFREVEVADTLIQLVEANAIHHPGLREELAEADTAHGAGSAHQAPKWMER